mmetsp:Transcript_39505/g.92905  ORF Transcript_39505/g.92905 Transcript_39505/m.92905 type:complete len:391 (+) Transcript_39505:54-1226(+)
MAKLAAKAVLAMLACGVATAEWQLTVWNPTRPKIAAGDDAERRLTGLAPLSGIWINELRNNLLLAGEGGAAWNYFELIWGLDVNPLDIVIVEFDSADGTLLNSYAFSSFSPSLINGALDESGVYSKLALLFPPGEVSPGVALMKNVSGELQMLECVSFADPFKVSQGSCTETGVFDLGRLSPVRENEVWTVEGPARVGFCPGGSWRPELLTPGALNMKQTSDVLAGVIPGFPPCPLAAQARRLAPEKEEAEVPRQECSACRAACESKAGFELELADDSLTFGVQVDDDDHDIYGKETLIPPTADAPNCDPSSGGWWCCVSSDVGKGKIYERDLGKCYVAAECPAQHQASESEISRSSCGSSSRLGGKHFAVTLRCHDLEAFLIFSCCGTS